MTMCVTKAYQDRPSFQEDSIPELVEIFKRQGFVYFSKFPSENLLASLKRELAHSRVISQRQDFHKVTLLSESNISFQTYGAETRDPPKLLLYPFEESAYSNYLYLSDSRYLLHGEFSSSEQEQLAKKLNRFSSRNKTKSIIAPILSFPRIGEILFRYSSKSLLQNDLSLDSDRSIAQNDLWLQSICQRIERFSLQNHISISMPRNSLLIINNHRILHARTLSHIPGSYL